MLKKILCCVVLLGVLVYPADAARKVRSAPVKAKSATHAPRVKPPVVREAAPPEETDEVVPADISSICVEAESGLVLSEHEADRVRPPASMIKMMLLLLVAEGVHGGQWQLDTPITVTAHAEKMGGTQVYVKQEEVWTLEQLMKAVTVASANDAAMTVAEGLWGSEEAYRTRMNERAQELGMVHSRFNSVHGLPPAPGQPADETTARDMSIVARECIKDPLIMGWCGAKELQFKPDQAVKFNTNKLLWRMPNCDGLKTGYTRAAGFCVTATAVRDGVRLIGIVMGCGSNNARFAEAETLLDGSFGEVRKVKVLTRGETLKRGVAVRNCRTEETRVAAAEDLWVVVKQSDLKRLELVPDLPDRIQAPVSSGTVIGSVCAELGGIKLASAPVLVPEELPEAGWRYKLKRGLSLAR